MAWQGSGWKPLFALATTLIAASAWGCVARAVPTPTPTPPGVGVAYTRPSTFASLEEARRGAAVPLCEPAYLPPGYVLKTVAVAPPPGAGGVPPEVLAVYTRPSQAGLDGTLELRQMRMPLEPTGEVTPVPLGDAQGTLQARRNGLAVSTLWWRRGGTTLILTAIALPQEALVGEELVRVAESVRCQR
ncbi:MAG: hypothetical protein HY686_08255 [Chloroflexi bacterium]|nr:hypothetical protein [Chloroflexota bacterium]